VDLMSPERPLAGLISLPAEQLYARIAANGGAHLGTGPDELDLDSAAGRELLDAGLLYATTLDQSRMRVVARTVALRLLLARRHGETTAAHQSVVDGWERLGALLDATLGIPRQPSPAVDRLLAQLTEDEAITRETAALCGAARHEIRRAVARGPLAGVPCRTDLELRVRTLYDRSLATGGPADASPHSETRINARVPLSMVLVDGEAAIVDITSVRGPKALLVRSPQLLALLRDWFDRTWDAPTTTVLKRGGHESLNPTQMRVLQLLAVGISDEAAAEACGITVRTVRRHIRAVLETLAVTSRFAVGVEAARRGWI
jgi:DNA-binding CsgD family transcriptional regulator